MHLKDYENDKFSCDDWEQCAYTGHGCPWLGHWNAGLFNFLLSQGSFKTLFYHQISSGHCTQTFIFTEYYNIMFYLRILRPPPLLLPGISLLTAELYCSTCRPSSAAGCKVSGTAEFRVMRGRAPRNAELSCSWGPSRSPLNTTFYRLLPAS